MTAPPVIDPAKLDFSEFHPLDHWPWQARCRRLPGREMRHVSLWWRHQQQYTSMLRRFTLCKIGHHRPGKWRKYDNNKPAWEYNECMDCEKELEPVKDLR